MNLNEAEAEQWRAANKESDVCGSARPKGKHQSVGPQRENRIPVAKVSSTFVYLIKKTHSLYSA